MNRNHISLIKSLFCYCHYFEKGYVPLLKLLYIFVLLTCHGDVELNPDPKKLEKIPSLSGAGILIL